MTSLIEEQRVGKLPYFDEIDPLFWSENITRQEHFRIIHHLTRVLQNGLNLHRREPGATMLYERYRLHQSDTRGMYHVAYVESTWHLSLPKVGILLATRKLYVNAARKRALNFGYSESRWVSADLLPADVSPETLDRLGLGDPVNYPWWVQ